MRKSLLVKELGFDHDTPVQIARERITEARAALVDPETAEIVDKDRHIQLGRMQHTLNAIDDATCLALPALGIMHRRST